MVTRQDRLSSLVNFIVEEGSVSVEQVVTPLGVSQATARRDLDALADQQLIQRTRGGASANPSSGEVPLRYRGGRRSSEKAAIAAYAAGLVIPGEVVGFNGGTTTTATAYELGVRIAAEPAFEHLPITVVTNAVNIANDLTIRPQARVVVTGGVARARSYELVGPLADLILPAIKIDTLFLGVTAIDDNGGCYTQYEDEAAINAALVRAARRTIIIADASKFGLSAFARICALSDAQILITDSGVSPADVARVEAAGVRVVTV